MEAHTEKVTPLLIEHIYPWLIGLAVFGLATGAHFLGVKLPSNDAFFSALVSLGGVFAGFMATLKAMLFGMEASTFKRLQQSGYMEDLINYLSCALWGSLVLCVVALVGFFDIATHVVVDAGVLAIVTFALSSIYRVTVIATNLFLARKE